MHSFLRSFNNIDRSGSPIPIEYLPAENTLSSKVRLMILYQNRPTTTIAVGDPLTLRIEAQDGYNQLTDIFATNVMARDPYSGRSIQLIDRYGYVLRFCWLLLCEIVKFLCFFQLVVNRCPVDPFVFPELDKLRSGDQLEARFNAFKIPESNFLVFEATVRTCREGCQPAYCQGAAGRNEPSFGRRRRSLNDTDDEDDDVDGDDSDMSETQQINGTLIVSSAKRNATGKDDGDDDDENTIDFPEQVREMIEVFESREEIENESIPRKLVAPSETLCISPSEYHGLVVAIVLLMLLLFSITLAAGLAYRRYWKTMLKNRSFDNASPVHSFIPSALHQNMNISSHQFNASTRHAAALGSTSGHLSGIRPSLSLINGTLQKTFATG